MPLLDTFKRQVRSLQSPVTSATEVTPSDQLDLPHTSRAVFVGTAGDLRVVMRDGQTVTFGALPAGWHPLRVTRVLAAGTTATQIVVCW